MKKLHEAINKFITQTNSTFLYNPIFNNYYVVNNDVYENAKAKSDQIISTN